MIPKNTSNGIWFMILVYFRLLSFMMTWQSFYQIFNIFPANFAKFFLQFTEEFSYFSILFHNFPFYYLKCHWFSSHKCMLDRKSQSTQLEHTFVCDKWWNIVDSHAFFIFISQIGIRQGCLRYKNDKHKSG